MEGPHFLVGAAFGPEALRVIAKAFDQAWEEIATEVGDSPLAIEAARQKLANAVLANASEDSRDAGDLKVMALSSFRQGAQH